MLCELSGYGIITALGEAAFMNTGSSCVPGWYRKIRQEGLSRENRCPGRDSKLEANSKIPTTIGNHFLVIKQSEP
jgi:hypothetical protein